MIHKLACTGLSPSVITFSKVFHFIYFINVAVLLPRYCRNNNGLGLSPVARRYWGNHFCFLLLQVLRCFSSLRLPTLRYNMSSTYWVIPFGDLRIKGYLHLNGAFRSLSRPSSPARAKASSVRPFFLFLCHTYSSVHTYQVAYILSAVFCPTPKGGDTFFIAFACPKCHRSIITLPEHATNKQRTGKDYCGE